ncbi:MAG: hypothetical protein ACRDZX_14425, partial [Acidimicrobiales bacterium]
PEPWHCRYGLARCGRPGVIGLWQHGGTPGLQGSLPWPLVRLAELRLGAMGAGLEWWPHCTDIAPALLAGHGCGPLTAAKVID